VPTAIIVNPHAGSLRRQPKLVESLRAVEGRDVSVFVTQDASELEEAAARAADRGATLIGVTGGDGTASMTLTAIERAYQGRKLPRIAFLRGGTMNTVANSITGGAPNKPVENLKRTIAAAKANGSMKVSRRPALRIAERLGFLFGTGVWHGYLAEYNQARGGMPTPVSAAAVFGRALASSALNGPMYRRMVETQQLAITHAEGDWPSFPYMTVCASTIAHAGLGFKPFHRATASEQAFQILAIRERPAVVLRDMPSVWLGRGLRPDTAHDTTTAWAELKCEGSFGYAVDGDLASAQGSLRIELGPTFEFLRI
jgi:diacylglycerol kinase (ATP)